MRNKLKLKNVTTTVVPNISQEIDYANWEEVEEILFPFQGANFSSPLYFIPAKPQESFIVLIICVVLLCLAFLIIGCRWWLRYGKSGYTPAPQDPEGKDQPSDNVIAEVKSRREQTRLVESKAQLPPPRSVHNVPGAKSSKQTNIIKLAQPPANNYKSGNAKRQTDIESSSSISVADSISSSSHVSIVGVNSSASRCPLSRPRSVKLIPHESLMIPRSVSDTIRNANSIQRMQNVSSTSVNLDRILSLSKIEKVKSQSNIVLQPTSSKSGEPLLVKNKSGSNSNVTTQKRYKEIDMNNIPHVDAMNLTMFRALHADVLSPEQKDEERAKFLKAFKHNEISRRRSLCTVCAKEKPIDQQLYDSLVYDAELAKKVQSMPTMSVGPFSPELTEPDRLNSNTIFHNTKSNVDQRNFPLWIHPVSASRAQSSSNVGSVNISRKESQSSMMSPAEWKEMNDAFSLLNKFSNTVPQQTSEETSKTSIWSTVASENNFELETEARTSSYEDIPVVPYTSSTVEMTDEQGLDYDRKLPAIKEISEEDSSKLETRNNLPDNDLIRFKDQSSNSSTTLVSTKRSLTAAQFIEQSASMTGYQSEETDRGSRSMDSGFLLESDLLPSELFLRPNDLNHLPNTSSRDSSDSSISNLIITSTKQGGFWTRRVKSRDNDNAQFIKEFDPCRVISSTTQLLRSLESENHNKNINSHPVPLTK